MLRSLNLFIYLFNLFTQLLDFLNTDLLIIPLCFLAGKVFSQFGKLLLQMHETILT